MEIPKFEIPTPTKEKAPETEAGPHFELEEKKTKWEKFKAAEEKEPKVPSPVTKIND